jgi:Arc/MetJ-type ribon-helix-helix transcriptional regulator
MAERRTTLRLPDELWREARVKAVAEKTNVSAVVRALLTLWVEDRLEARSKEKLYRLAREAFGMWADRDPDEYLARSRAGLLERDQEVEDARLAL